MVMKMMYVFVVLSCLKFSKIAIYCITSSPITHS